MATWRSVGQDRGCGNPSAARLEVRMKMLIQRLVIFSAIVVAFLSARQLDAADSEVSGVSKRNDQPATLGFVSAQKCTAIAGKETIKLVFTEKDHAKDQQADLKALFGNYGSALIIGIQ